MFLSRNMLVSSLFLLIFSGGVALASGTGKSSGSGDGGGSECLKTYNLLKKNNAIFAGYGRGPVSDIAVDVARTDLLKEISTKVTSSSKVHETAKTVTVETETDSKVNFLLVDSRVSKRCVAKGSHEAVVVLYREAFVKNLKVRIEGLDERARGLLERIRAAKGDERTDALVEARGFLERSEFAETNNLCVTYGGCVNVKTGNILDLEKMVEEKDNASEVAAASNFALELEGQLAEEVEGEVRSLLIADGVKVVKGGSPHSVVRVHCSEQLFPKPAGMEYQVLDLTCRAVGTVKGKQKFAYEYNGRGTGRTGSEARVGARNQLSRVK